MPGPNHILDKDYKAMSPVSRFHFVKRVTTAKEQCTAITAATDKPLGVCQDEIEAADAGRQVADIRPTGITRAIAGGAITVGDNCVLTATGRVVTQGGAAAGTAIVGIAETAAAANGDHIDLTLTPGAKV